MQLSLPCGVHSTSPLAPMSHEYHADGKARILVTNLLHVADYVVRVISDERTLNQYVIIWEDERPMHAAWDVGAPASGEPDAMNALKILVGLSRLSCQRPACTHADQPRPIY